jgi:hypothetical protein
VKGVADAAALAVDALDTTVRSGALALVDTADAADIPDAADASGAIDAVDAGDAPDAVDAPDAMDAPDVWSAPDDDTAACVSAATAPEREEAARAASGPCACATESGSSSAGDKSASTEACHARYSAKPQNAVATVATRRNRRRVCLAASWPIRAESERNREFVIGSFIGSARHYV